MDIQKINLQSDDYLDLYLYAEKIGDSLWQQEIIGKLMNINHDKNSSKLPGLHLHIERYKLINNEILSIYQQIRFQSSTDNLEEQIHSLKQQRLLLGRQINLFTNQTWQ